MFVNSERIRVAIISVLLMLTMVTTLSFDVCFAAEKIDKSQIKEPVVSAGSFIVLSGSTSEVVYEQYSERKMSIGNITKFMTAMVVIDNMYDSSEYENVIEIKSDVDAYGDLFAVGDNITVEDMLYAMLVGGSDEAAEALAAYSASDRSIFINMMNSKAMELDLMNTQYTNPTGRYHTDHYSTAADSAVIVQAAMRYPKIAQITKTDTHAIQLLNASGKKTLTLANTNPLLSSTKASERYDKTIGGILSTLEEPNRSAQYAGVAVDDGMQLIVIMLDAQPKSVAKGAQSLLKYGFKMVTRNTIVKADEKVGKVKVKYGAQTRVPAYTETKGYAYIPPEGSTDLVQTQVVLFDDVCAPLKSGDKVGEYRIYVADELKGTVNLVVKKDVKRGWFPSGIYISNLASVLIFLLLLLIVLFIARVVYVKKRRAKLRERKRQAMIREAAKRQMALEEDRKRRNWTYK